jgi:hypothetical protein
MLQSAMKRIQVVLDDQAGIQPHLKHRQDLELEECDRRGYVTRPQSENESRIWEDVASWPED